MVKSLNPCNILQFSKVNSYLSPVYKNSVETLSNLIQKIKTFINKIYNNIRSYFNGSNNAENTQFEADLIPESGDGREQKIFNSSHSTGDVQPKEEIVNFEEKASATEDDRPVEQETVTEEQKSQDKEPAVEAPHEEDQSVKEPKEKQIRQDASAIPAEEKPVEQEVFEIVSEDSNPAITKVEKDFSLTTELSQVLGIIRDVLDPRIKDKTKKDLKDLNEQEIEILKNFLSNPKALELVKDVELDNIILSIIKGTEKLDDFISKILNKKSKKNERVKSAILKVYKEEPPCSDVKESEDTKVSSTETKETIDEAEKLEQWKTLIRNFVTRYEEFRESSNELIEYDDQKYITEEEINIFKDLLIGPNKIQNINVDDLAYGIQYLLVTTQKLDQIFFEILLDKGKYQHDEAQKVLKNCFHNIPRNAHPHVIKRGRSWSEKQRFFIRQNSQAQLDNIRLQK